MDNITHLDRLSVLVKNVTAEEWQSLDRVDQFHLILKAKIPDGVTEQMVFDSFIRCHTHQKHICDECTRFDQWTQGDRLHGQYLGHHPQCSQWSASAHEQGMRDYLNFYIPEAKKWQ